MERPTCGNGALFYGNQKRERLWTRHPPRARPEEPRSHMLPRRGPSEALIKVQRQYQHGERVKRQSRWSNPGGTRQGGPESRRSAEKTSRWLCGCPERSADYPQTPPKTCHVKTNGKTDVKTGRPTIITIDKTSVKENGTALMSHCVETLPISGRHWRRHEDSPREGG